MAMTQAGLSTAIQTEIIAEKGAPSDASKLAEFSDAIAKAVIDYIKANMDVTTVVASGIPVQVNTVTGTGSTIGTGVAAKNGPGAVS